jgi:hypothetical protein
VDLTALRKAITLDHRALSGLTYLAGGALLLVKVAGRWTIPGWSTYRKRSFPVVQAAVRELLGDPPGTASKSVAARTFGQHVVYVVELPPVTTLWRPRLPAGIESFVWARPGDLKVADCEPVIAHMLNAPAFWKTVATQTWNPNLMPGFEINYQRSKQRPYDTNYLPPGT